MQGRYWTVIIGLMVFIAGACADRNKKGELMDTPTYGVIKIAVDESLKPLIEAEIDTFEGLYKDAHIQAQYMSETNAIDALLKDSVRMIVTTRKLAKEEEDAIVASKIFPTQLKIAKDGIAIILNKSNPDTLIQLNQLKSILDGTITNWKQINPSAKSLPLQVVFDSPNSGMIRFLSDSVTPISIDKIPATFYALNSNKAVVDFVSQNANAIGLIGVSWISNKHDSTATSFLRSVRIAGLQKDTGEYYQPYQAYLAMGQYALQRDVHMISREARSGLATGFMAFVASDRGQRIVLKSGLVPSTMPLRIVEIKHGQLSE